MPITPTKKIWMDGTFVDWPDATVHVLSHTLHYGTGAFEGIRAYKTPNGVAIFRVNELHDGCYIRPIIYLGYGEMGVNPMGSPVNTAIAAWPWGAYLGEEASLNG